MLDINIDHDHDIDIGVAKGSGNLVSAAIQWYQQRVTHFQVSGGQPPL